MTIDRTHEERVEPNLLHSCQTWARAADGGWVLAAEGVVAMGCEARHRAFNQTFLTSPTPDVATLRDAISRYEHGPFRMRFRDELHEALTPLLLELGLERQGGIPTMTSTLRGEVSTSETGLRIGRVADHAKLADHVRVVAEGFSGWMPETLGRVFTAKLLDEPSWVAWVGYEDGDPVASSQLVVHDNVAGLYYIATLETARRKGYGDAITRHAIREGQARGCDLVCLQASSSGRPVYERLGFNVIGEYITYVPREDA